MSSPDRPAETSQKVAMDSEQQKNAESASTEQPQSTESLAVAEPSLTLEAEEELEAVTSAVLDIMAM